MNKKNCKKFVAFVDGNGFENGESGFYITDVDYWNENQEADLTADYTEGVYLAIEDLGEDCILDGVNHFSINQAVNNKRDLFELLLSLPWIVAIDELEDSYVEPKNIDEFVAKKEKVLDVVKSFKGNVKVDDIICKYRNSSLNTFFHYEMCEASDSFYRYARENGIPNKHFYPGGEEECKAWMEKFSDKVIYCIPIDRTRVKLYAFDDEKTINDIKANSKSYQKLLSNLNLFGKRNCHTLKLIADEADDKEL